MNQMKFPFFYGLKTLKKLYIVCKERNDYMRIKFKKIKNVFLALLTGTLILGATSCNKASFDVLKFESDKVSYEENEDIVFKISLSNPEKYKVVGATINDSFYESEESLSTQNVTIKGIKHNSSQLQYTLSSVKYLNNNKTEEFKTNKVVFVNNPVSTKGDIEVTNFQVNAPGSEKILHFDDIAKVHIDIKKKRPVKIVSFYFTVNGKNIEKKVLDNDTKSSYDIDVEIPKSSPDVRDAKVKFSLNRIDYIKSTSLRSLNETSEIIKDVTTHSLELLKFEVTDPNGSFTKDINGVNYVDNNSVINIKLEFRNKSHVEPTALYISGNKVILEKGDIEYVPVADKIIIKKQLKLTSITSKDASIKLETVTYDSDSEKAMSIHKTIKSDVKVYDKIIMNERDLASLMVKDGKIIGNYILGSDVTITNTDNMLFTNKSFDGYLNANGHTITTVTNKPMFDIIGTDAIIENLILSSNNSTSNLICNENNGVIRNIALQGALGDSKRGNEEPRFLICSTNMGSINDIDITTSINGSKQTFGIVDKNRGSINQISIDFNYVSTGQNLFFATPFDNEGGEYKNVLLALNSWYSVAETDIEKQVHFANKIIAKTDEGITKNVILNVDVRSKTESYNKVLQGPKSGDIVTKTAGLLFGNISKLYNKISDLIKNEDLSEIGNVITDSNGKKFYYYPYVVVSSEENKKNDLELGKVNEDLLIRLGFIKFNRDRNGFGNNRFWVNRSNKFILDFKSSNRI